MESCGAELAGGAIIPEQIARLMDHVSNNMVAHAHWVGTATDACRAEHVALLEVARLFRNTASCARSAAVAMRSMQHLDPAPHDPERWDRVAFVAWMQRKLELQTELGNLLLAHVDQARQNLDDA